MVMLNEGLNKMRDDLQTAIDKGQLGTGTNASSPTDTGLQTEDSNTLIAVGEATADQQLTTTYILPTTTGEGITYTEYENQDTSNSVNFDRIIFTGIAKTTAKQIIIKRRYFFRTV